MVRTFAATLGLVAFLVVGSANAGTDPQDKCADSKAKTAGKKAQGLLKAFGKNISKNPDTKLGANISKAQSKFTKGFTKAESKGSCFSTGDASAIEAKVDALTFDVIEQFGATCGNNVQGPGEQCDGTDDAACPGSCLGSCSCDFCGNNIALAEECDGTDDSACGGRACLADCTCNPCGNDVIDGGEECDGTDDSACPGICNANCTCPTPVCGNGVYETATEECDPPTPGTQGSCAGGEVCNGFCECEAVAACDCGSTTPLVYGYTNKAPTTPTCGTTDGVITPILECIGLYIGAGGGSLPVPASSPDEGENLHNVTFCNGTSLGVTATSVSDTGSYRNCSEGPKCSTAGTDCASDDDCPALETCDDQCLFGAPLSILNRGLPGLSTCVINSYARDAVGGVNCATGESTINQPLNSRVHLNGKDYSVSTPGYQPCPVCLGGTLNVTDSGTCEGGPNGRKCSISTSVRCDTNGDLDCLFCVGGTDAGTACLANSDCTSNVCGETCNLGDPCTPMSTTYDTDATCCQGPIGQYAGCTDDSDCPFGTCEAGCTVYPTSHDCPPEPNTDIGVIPVPFELTTGVSAKSDAGGQFCGFCRDVNPGPGNDPGGACFEGDQGLEVPPATCPDSNTIACDATSGVDVSECGDAVPCRTDSDCVAPYETCEQRSAGAFRDPGVTAFSLTGAAAGDMRDWAAHAASVVSAFCIQNSFTAAIDASAELGGPGAVSLPGEGQLYSPSGAFVELTPELLD